MNLGVFALQESHAKKKGGIKFENSDKYQIYEMTRKIKCGGGLVTGVLKELNPMWIKDGGDNVEAMTIKCSFKILR